MFVPMFVGPILVGVVQSIAIIAACVLVFAGVPKLVLPRATAAALVVALRIPRRMATPAARVLGLVEVSVAVAALAGLRPALAAVAALYGALAGFAALAVRRGAACGCIGDGERPATRGHVVFDLVAAAGAAVALRVDSLALSSIDGTERVLFAAAIGLATILAVQVLTVVRPAPATRQVRA